jgi:hypothetical protein
MARTITYRTFRGITNILPEDSLVSKEGVFLRTVTNADIDNAGRIRRRKGTDLSASGDVHSLWSDNNLCFFRQTTYLKQMFSDYTTRTIRNDIPDNDLPMSFLSLNGLVYYSDSQVTGIVVDSGRASRSWGIVPPPVPPISATVGNLPAGRYLIATTYLRTDGQESGTGSLAAIALSSPGGINVTLTASSDTDVDRIRVYASSPDGEMLYLAGQYDNTTATVRHSGDTELGGEIKTLFLQEAPAGHMLEYFNSKIYIASGPYLFPSKPFAYELFDMDDYLPFDGVISLLAAVEDGLFISDGKKTYFLHDGKKRTEVCPYGAIPGTAVKVDLATIGDGTQEGKAVMWASQKGVILGTKGGQATNLTEKNFVYPKALSGAALFRQHNGINQYMALLRQEDVIAEQAYEWQKLTADLEMPTPNISGTA